MTPDAHGEIVEWHPSNHAKVSNKYITPPSKYAELPRNHTELTCKYPKQPQNLA